MSRFLYWIVELIARIHGYLLKLNDAYEYNFSDKELHFLIIGALGMAMIFVVHPVFKWLLFRNQRGISSDSWVDPQKTRGDGIGVCFCDPADEQGRSEQASSHHWLCRQVRWV